jgi:tRNA modification GTPase
VSPAPPSDDTIVAISTPPGRGGIGAVRLSGPQAGAIAGHLFRAARSVAPNRGTSDSGTPDSGESVDGARTVAEPGRAIFGSLLGPDGGPIDQGYLIHFRPPRSFTGEEVAELWAHGSPPVLRALVEAAVARGARPATPGEFALRAFLNGRIDATQAEAIRELVEARTLHQARVAHAQSTGTVARAVAELKERLVETVAHVEAAIEFAEEPEATRFLPEGGILARARGVRFAIERLAASFERGRRIRDGAVVALSGRPNVGKSSLFNRLLSEERAIVTPLAGTTRDLLEETIEMDGVPVLLVDTAGLHAPGDEAEAEAVRRARAAAAGADQVIVVLDWSRPLRAEEMESLDGMDATRAIVVLNKVDATCGIGLDRVLYLRKRHDVLEVSARTGAGLEDLRRRLLSRVSPAGALRPDELFLTSLRQRDLLTRAAESLRRAEAAGRDGLGGECIALDLREALDRLGEITGEVGLDEIYDQLFSRFCIGK